MNSVESFLPLVQRPIRIRQSILFHGKRRPPPTEAKRGVIVCHRLASSSVLTPLCCTPLYCVLPRCQVRP